jgi:hypothetical protein
VNTPQQIRPGQLYQKTKPVRDREYLRFIKRLPCVCCLKTWWIDPAHTGAHATGQKASDLDCIPLCRKCHIEFDACQWRFAERHHLDIPALILMFQHFYANKLKGRAA